MKKNFFSSALFFGILITSGHLWSMQSKKNSRHLIAALFPSAKEQNRMIKKHRKQWFSIKQVLVATNFIMIFSPLFGGDAELLNMQNDEGNTLLHSILLENKYHHSRIELAEFLINEGANLHLANNDDQTPLGLITENKNYKTLLAAVKRNQTLEKSSDN